MRLKGSRKFADDGRRNLSTVAELVEIDPPPAIIEGHFIRGYPTFVGLIDPFVLHGFEMLHLDQHQVTIAGEVRELAEFSLFVLVIVQEPAAKMTDDKMRESGGQIGRAARSFNMNGHSATL